MAIFFDSNHLHQIQIHHRPNSFNRPGITVIGWIAAKETQWPGYAARAILFRP